MIRYIVTVNDDGTMDVEMGGVTYRVTEAHFAFEGPGGEATALLNHVIGRAPEANPMPRDARTGFEYMNGQNE